MALFHLTIKDATDVVRNIATDLFDSDKLAQIIKIGFGPAGATPTQVSSTNPLPVDSKTVVQTAFVYNSSGYLTSYIEGGQTITIARNASNQVTSITKA